MDQIVHRVLRFDRFALDLTRGSLRRGERDIDLTPKAFEVLRHLAENAGRLVPKQELHRAIWANVAVTDDSLVQCIRELRLKLGDDTHSLIKTIPQYRSSTLGRLNRNLSRSCRDRFPRSRPGRGCPEPRWNASRGLPSLALRRPLILAG